MELVCELSNNGYYQLYLNNEYIVTDFYSNSIKNAILDFKNQVMIACDELLQNHNICKLCNEPCGYMQYTNIDKDFYCPNCEGKYNK